jgi:hypothetical protein
MPVGESGTAQAIQPILIGLDFHDNQVYALWRGQNNFYIGDQGCHMFSYARDSKS